MLRIGNIELPSFPLLLAPMEDVSDPPFRVICKKLGADLVYTEFVSSEGLIREAAKSLKKLDIFAHERPVGVQLFGEDLVVMRDAVKIIEKVQPDLIDINYGCPVKKVVCKGAGAAILKDPQKMERLTREVVRATSLPVTVKTRLGWDENSINIIEVALRLQDAGIQALTIHARTRAQMYKGSANWEYIHQVKTHPSIQIPIFGNGDVDSPQKAHYLRTTFAVDGMMIGRGAIGNPWIFREIKHYFATGNLLVPPSTQERVAICRQHLEESIAWKGEKTGIYEMRRHYANYFKGYPDIKVYRNRLVQANELLEILDILTEIEQKYSSFAAELSL
ncbi:MAG: tRNA dihydrouridine synthase DusB [Bacteroidia bacterium]|nr:tRNA dihydrouridine synthase DusB [Bacteroidia bacterium]MDW8158915.1 tRNA dihydrouridine synthase DusB [Bacteroidia bacterium]